MVQNELISIQLAGDEVELLALGLIEWGGPAHCTDRLALAMGFASVQDLLEQAAPLIRALREAEPLSSSDWTRALLATEVSFASDVLGSGVDWGSTTGWTDEQTVMVLRRLQRKLGLHGAISRASLED